MKKNPKIFFQSPFSLKRIFDWETQEKSIQLFPKIALPPQSGPKRL